MNACAVRTIKEGKGTGSIAALFEKPLPHEAIRAYTIESGEVFPICKHCGCHFEEKSP